MTLTILLTPVYSLIAVHDSNLANKLDPRVDANAVNHQQVRYTKSCPSEADGFCSRNGLPRHPSSLLATTISRPATDLSSHPTLTFQNQTRGGLAHHDPNYVPGQESHLTHQDQYSRQGGLAGISGGAGALSFCTSCHSITCSPLLSSVPFGTFIVMRLRL